MKNVCLFIIALLLFWNGYSQDLQNANWYFGNHAGLSFYPNINNPTSINGSAMDVAFGCASVSDQLGNLLFYTDGVTVWNKNHLPMTNGNGLKGHANNMQGVIIVPKPGNVNNYFIITIDGEIGQKKGLYYSEVDMSVGLGTIILITKNKVLKDHNYINIDDSYNNSSQRLTSTIKSNSSDYWVITHIGGYIYSYSVTSTGIDPLPVSSPAPFTIINSSSQYGYGSGQIKISPNTQRIADLTRISSSPSGVQANIALGSYDTSTGQAMFDSNQIIVTGLYSNGSQYKALCGLEFSPNSQYIYYGTDTDIYYTSSSTSPIQTITIYNNTLTNNQVLSLQLAINGKIYLSVSGSSYLAAINFPNNPVNPSFQLLASNLGNNSTRGGLPQFVHWNKFISCSTLTLMSEPNLTAFTYSNRSNITVTSTYVLNSGQDITMKARDFIVLKPETHIKSGSLYLGKIQDCDSETTPLPRMADARTEETNKISTLNKPDLFSFSPNPASTLVTITSAENIKAITVTSIDGKVMFNGTLPDKTFTYRLDVSSYHQGYYTVVVITATGETETQKLIKN